MNRTSKALIVGVALTGLLTGTAARLHAATDSSAPAKAGQQLASSSSDTQSCKGQNTCKGKGGCKTGDNGCKGKNTCKGKGGCKSA
jgi:hypothetical protein